MSVNTFLIAVATVALAAAVGNAGIRRSHAVVPRSSATSAQGRLHTPPKAALQAPSQASSQAAPRTSQPTFNEPAGMAAQINTGLMSAVPTALSMFSPATATAEGEWRGNLSTVPGGTGLRVTYPPMLSGGYSPVRFGMKIGSAGTGWYYQRMKIRFSPNWTLSGNVAMKFCEPRTTKSGSGAGPEENHVIGAHDFATQSTRSFLYVLLQGPNRQARNLFEQPRYGHVANLNDGKWHRVELLFTPESSPGAGDGAYSGWVDGVRIAHYADVTWLARDNAPGWPYLMFDPTYGGGKHVPGQNMYWDFDELYVSTR